MWIFKLGEGSVDRRAETFCNGIGNMVVLAGTVSADPVLRRVQSGDEVTELRPEPDRVVAPGIKKLESVEN
jgi:hypothetical protein